MKLFFDTDHYLHIKCFLGAIQDLLYDLSVELFVGIAIIEKGIAVIIHVTRIIPRETEDIATLPLNAIQLKFQIDCAAVVFNPHKVNDRLAISSSKVLCVTREQGHLCVNKTLDIFWIRDGIELPNVDSHVSSSVAPGHVTSLRVFYKLEHLC